jgi:tetratricopeptide (TPR) repeat protein
MCVEIVQQRDVFAKLTMLRPNDARVWYVRGRLNATRSQWTQAIPDLEKALQFCRAEWSRGSRSHVGWDWSRQGRWMANVTNDLAAVRVLAESDPRLDDLWEIVSGRHSAVNDWIAAQLFCRACAIMPGAVTDWSIPIRLAEPTVVKQPRNAWCLFGLGANQYRAGQIDEAVTTLKKSLEVHPVWVGRGKNYAVLALASQRLGRNDEARDWLAQAKTWLEETNQAMAKNEFGFAASSYLTDWLSAQVLLREAEMLVGNGG